MDNQGLIHKFSLNDRNIILDVYSGGVHVVDDLVYDMVDYYNSKSLEEIIKILGGKYNPDDIVEAYKEIKHLVENDLLYSFYDEIYTINYNSDNIVKALCLHVAHDCDLRCKYCFASQGDFKGDRSLMSLSIGKKALDFLVKNSGARRNLEVDFFGGEPLLNFNVVKELVAYGREIEKENDKKFRFTLTTNGMKLDDEIIDFINENMSNVVLSLDGRKEINDNMRQTINGKGSYEIILPKFKKLVENRNDGDYYIRGTFTRHNLDFSKDILDFFKHGFKKVSVEPVVTTPDKDYSIRVEDLPKIFEEYERFSEEYIKLKKKDDDFLFFHYMIDLNDSPCLAKRTTGCGAGSEYLAVTPQGELYPCHQFVGDKDFLMGDVFNGVNNSLLMDKFKNANINNKSSCKDCWAKYYCSGGCHANAYNYNKDLFKPLEIACEMEKKRIECAISILANLND